MADKDFKVKSGLDLGTPLPLTEGGTGQTSATNALNALLPLQTSESGKVLSTNGTSTSWLTLPNGYSKGNTASRPASPSLGDIYSNTQTGYIEVYTAAGWSQLGVIPTSATSAIATDVGTSRAFNNGAASVAFTAGSGGGLPSSFTATSTTGGYSNSGSSSPIVVTGIPSNTALTFTVTATNGYGNALASAASASATITTVPQAPTIGTATNTTGVANGASAIAALTFTAAATGGKTITNYKYSTDGTNYTAFSPAQTTSPLSITGLTSGTSYSFYLKAVNANGDSTASSASNSVTVSTIAANPTLGTPTVTSTTVVSIPFTAGATGNSTITGYTITSSPSIALSYSTSQTNSPIAVTGSYVQGTAYTFNVKANNANGSSTGVNSSSITPFPTAVVTGGTLSSDATYYYRTFRSTADLVVSNAPLTADYLVIAGGGSGGPGVYNAYTTVFISRGSGGGAGGQVGGSATIAAGTYTATVGAGGVAANGNNSSFNSLSAIAGGFGQSGSAGGSGGGVQGYQGTYSGTYGTTGGAGTAGQGNKGGNINADHYSSASGGGGAGSAGTNSASNGSTTAPGAGSNTYSSWASATSTGVSGFFAGGGGPQTIAGGSGGGGTGGATGFYGNNNASAVGGPGTANTGGGGGGGATPQGTGSVQFHTNSGGSGGSGLVIVRYTRAQVGG
jgi:hypothetical protein